MKLTLNKLLKKKLIKRRRRFRRLSSLLIKGAAFTRLQERNFINGVGLKKSGIKFAVKKARKKEKSIKQRIKKKKKFIPDFFTRPFTFKKVRKKIVEFKMKKAIRLRLAFRLRRKRRFRKKRFGIKRIRGRRIKIRIYNSKFRKRRFKSRVRRAIRLRRLKKRIFYPKAIYKKIVFKRKERKKQKKKIGSFRAICKLALAFLRKRAKKRRIIPRIGGIVRRRRIKVVTRTIRKGKRKRRVTRLKIVRYRIIKKNKKIKKILSKRINLDLFRLTYDMLLTYHSPLGKRTGEWKPGVMLTNILLIRNTISIMDLTTIFFSLRKMISRLFKALKLRKGVAVLNGRKYSWQKVFTFVFERWLPGFFTNFYRNIKELVSYSIKKKALTRRQKTRRLSLKMLSYESKFLYFRSKRKSRDFWLLKKISKIVIRQRLKTKMGFEERRKKRIQIVIAYKKQESRAKKRSRNKEKRRLAEIRKRKIRLISFMKLPAVSLSLFDNIYWLRECQKEGIASIQVTDVSSEIEKLDYPIISNQKSIAFLSFIILLAKEIAYQARYWELTNFKKVKNYYQFNDRLKRDSVKTAFEYKIKQKGNRYSGYKKRVASNYRRKRKRYARKTERRLYVRTRIVNEK